MDASQALADLTEISAQIEAAVIAERSGAVVASTIRNEERAARFARAAGGLLAAAEEASSSSPIQLEAVLGDASVFVVKEGDRLIAAVTAPDPTVGLVFYDLKSCLRSVATADESAAEEPPAEEPTAQEPEPEAPPKPPRARKPKKADDEEGEDAEA